MGDQSAITHDLAVDDPVKLAADFRFDEHDRRYIDNQIRGIETHIVDLLIRGILGTWTVLDGGSAPISIGDWVCLASLTDDGRRVTRATAAALANAGAGYGIALSNAAPGSGLMVAVMGGIPASLSGLAPTGTPGFARINLSTARTEYVATPSGGDYIVGVVDTQGNVTISRLPVATGEPIEGAATGNVTGLYSGPLEVVAIRDTFITTPGGSLEPGQVLIAGDVNHAGFGAPDFVDQNVSTTGTLSAGATTVTALTDTALGVGVVHSSAGGVFTSSLVDLATDVTGVLPLASLATIAPFDTVNHGGSRTLKGISATEFASLNARSVVWTQSFLDFWRWVPGSTVTADDITYCNPTVNGVNPGRFERLNLASPAWMRQLEWCVKPSTGHDENVGTKASPLATDDERLRRWGERPIWAVSEYHVHFPEDLPSITIAGRRTDAVTVFVHANTTPGQGKSVLYTGTIDALQTLAPATNVPWAITSTALPTSWTASSLVAKRFRLTSGTNAGAKSWIVKDLAAKKAMCCEFYNSGAYAMPFALQPTLAPPSATNTFVIEDLVTVQRLTVDMVGSRGTNSAFGLVFDGFNIGGTTGRTNIRSSDRIVFDGCTMAGVSTQGSINILSAFNCQIGWSAGGAEPVPIALNIVGGYTTNLGGGSSNNFGALNASIITNFMIYGVRTKWSCPGSMEGGTRFNGNIAIFDCAAGGGAINVQDKSQVEAGAIFFGTGNTVEIVRVNNGAGFNFATTPVSTQFPVVTSLGVDFLMSTLGPFTSRAYDTVTGLYSAPIPTTWANFFLPVVSGGFGSNINDPFSGARMGITH